MASLFHQASVLPVANDPSDSGGRSQKPVSPGPSDKQSTQPSRSSNMFRRMSNRCDTFGPDSFYTDADFKDYAPRGPASVAAQLMYYPNLSPLRSFNWLTYRILSDYHVKLHRLSDGLYGLDVETEEGGGKGEDEDDTQSERRERLMAEIKPLYKEYREFVLMEKEFQLLPKVTPRAHAEHYRKARDFHGLSEEELESFRYRDDFVTVTPDITWQRFEFLLYSKLPLVAKFLRLVTRLFGQAPESEAGGSGGDDRRVAEEHGARAFRWAVKGALGLACCALFLTPVGVLYLGDLSRGGLFGVTVGFSVLFAAVLVLFEDRIGPTLLGNGAYMAVMVVFLSNVNDCSQR